MDSSLRIATYTPWRDRCGVSDYSRLLIDGLNRTGEIATVRVVAAPERQAMGGLAAARAYLADERLYASLGTQISCDPAGSRTDLAHIQHQYFALGGVAPHKNHARALLDAVTIPAVMTVHEIVEPLGGVRAAAVRRVNRDNFQHPAIRLLIVHTQGDADLLTGMDVSPGKVRLVRHGVPAAQPMPDSDTAHARLGLCGRRVVTLFGFLSRKKGHSIALGALPLLPPDVTLLFAGDRHPDDTTDYVAGLQREIAARGLGDRVVITGYLQPDQIPPVMAATSVAVCPFLATSGSGSLATLLAYGVPIVASDIGPHREIAEEAPCLALFEAGSAAALAHTLTRLLASPCELAALSAAARTYAASHSYESMARQTIEVYREALQ